MLFRLHRYLILHYFLFNLLNIRRRQFVGFDHLAPLDIEGKLFCQQEIDQDAKRPAVGLETVGPILHDLWCTIPDIAKAPDGLLVFCEDFCAFNF